MGCNKCKQKKSKFNVDFEETANSNGLFKKFDIEGGITQEDLSKSLFLRSIIFFILIAGFPLIYLGVIIMVFINFFVPSKNPQSVFTDSFEWIVKKYVEFKTRRQMRKMEKEYEKKKSYSGDNELTDIEIFETEEETEVETEENNVDVDVK